MKKDTSSIPVQGRREFLTKVSLTTALGLFGASGSMGAYSAENSIYPDQPSNTMPSIMLGQHKISRLVCGSNPILGYSYQG